MFNVLRWLLFGALVSLLPLGYVYADLVMRSKPVSLESLIGNGELLVIIWVLSASAFGELYGNEGANRYAKMIFGGATFLVILASALFFASIAEARANNLPINDHFVVNISVILFVISLVPSCACLGCMEE